MHFVVQTYGAHWALAGLTLGSHSCFGLLSALRVCTNLKVFAAKSNQQLFSLPLDDAELTVYAQAHGEHTSKRLMLFEALAQLGLGDVLVLNRGHAVLIDVCARVLADNFIALVCMEAFDDAGLVTDNRSCNRAYAREPVCNGC